MYFETKLMEKVNHRLQMNGDKLLDLDYFIKICNDVTLGRYQIEWITSKTVKLKRIKDEYTVTQDSGRYIVMNSPKKMLLFGKIILKLFSSEYIEFTLKEQRDFKVKMLLNQ